MTPPDATPRPSNAGFRVELRDRLPLPLARLYRRAFNAKSKFERHHAAYFLLEAVVKTAAAAQVAVYLAAGVHDPAFEGRLARLARPSVGDWVAVLRDVALRTSSLEAHPFAEVAPVSASIREKRADLTAVRDAVVAMGARVEGVPTFGGARASASDLFERLPAYRNQAIAHSALRPDEGFYDEMGALLLGAALEVLERVPLLGQATLTYVAEVREAPQAERIVDLWDMTGPEPLRDTTSAGAGDEGAAVLRAGHLYLRRGNAFLDLHPLLVCAPVPPEASIVYLNRSHEGRVEYLDYVSGETSTAPGLLDDHRRILGRILGRELSAAGLEGLVPAEPVSPAPAAVAGTPEVRRFGDFDLLSILGEGGMGTVFFAIQRSLDRPVALKMLPPSLSSSEVASGRFLREIRALARADHPNVVRILASGRTEGTFWYAMEYVDGSDLREVGEAIGHTSSRAALTSDDLASAVSTASDRHVPAVTLPMAPRPPPPDLHDGKPFYVRIAEVFRDAALGLHHLHERGIVHRDVSPRNLMLTRGEGRVVVMDLGLARIAGDATLTAATAVLGTLAYASPEQITEGAGGRRADARTDVYGLGATLYEMATGRPPYAGASPRELATLVLRRPPDPPRSLDRHVPLELDAIIRRAMEPEPARRYPSAAAFADDLDRFSRDEPIAARPPGLRYLARVWVRRNVAATVVAGVAALLMMIGLALFLRSLADQRDRALAAEDAANRSRDRAEGLAQFMLKDLQRKLGSLGQLDLLAPVAERTQAYYDELLRDDRSSATLARGAQAFSNLAGVLRGGGRLAEAADLQVKAVGLAREALVRENSAERRAELAGILVPLGDVRREQGDLAGALVVYTEARDNLLALVAARPKESTFVLALASSIERLGAATVRSDLALGLSYLRDAHARREALVKSDPSRREWRLELANSHVTLGSAIEADIKASLEEYAAARKIVADLAASDPSDASLADSEADVLSNTGTALKEQGDLTTALEAMEAARRVRLRISQQDATNGARAFALAKSVWDVGEVRFARGELVEALTEFRDAEARFGRLFDENRANRDWEREYGRSHATVGNVLLAQGDAQEAKKSYEAAHAIRKHLADADPAAVRGRRDMGFGLYLIGEACALLGDEDGALEEHLASLATRRALVALTPQSTRHPRDLYLSLVAVGDRRSVRSEPREALDAYREAAQTMARLAALDARNRAWRFDTGVVRGRLASALLANQDAAGARVEVEESTSVLRALRDLDPTNAQWTEAYVDALLRACDIRRALGDAPGAAHACEGAEEAARGFLKRVPTNPPLRRRLAAALAQVGEARRSAGAHDAAVAAFVEAEGIARALTEAQPSAAVWRVEHGRILARLDAVRAER